MKRRIHDALLGIAGLAGLAFFALSGTSCEGPKMQCAVGHGPFTIVYETVVSGDAACYEAAHKAYGGACAGYGLYDDDPDCAGLARVENVGFSTFLGVKGKKETVVTYHVDDDKNPATPEADDDSDPTQPDVPKQYTIATAESADYNTRKIAVQSSTFGSLYDGANEPTDKPYGFGDYTSNPDANDRCFAGTSGAPLSVATMHVDVGGTIVEMRQQWSDVEFFVTTGVPGTQVVGNMKFDNITDGCSVEYKFTGLYPSVFCGNPVYGHRDDDGDPMTPSDNDTDDDDDPMTPADNDQDADPATPDTPDEEVVVGYDPDDLNCDPKADPAAGRVYGSGINPDFQTYCHPELLHCVLKEGTSLIK